MFTFCLNVEIPVTYKLLTLTSPTNLVAVTIPVKNALVPVTKPTVVIPITLRFWVSILVTSISPALILTSAIVAIPVTERLRVVEVPDTASVEVVVTPVTFRLSIVVPPLKLDIPKTSSNTFGSVLPIPIRLLFSSNTKFKAPSTNPAELWYWIFRYVPPAPALIVPWLIQIKPPKLFFTKSWLLVPGSFK